MIKPPYRPRKGRPPSPYAAEYAAAGMWPYGTGKGVKTRPPRVSIDGKEIAAFRPGILVVSGDVEDFSPCDT